MLAICSLILASLSSASFSPRPLAAAAALAATPAPQPERAIYGFFLLSSAILSFAVYALVSYLPSPVLGHLGWDYLPDK